MQESSAQRRADHPDQGTDQHNKTALYWACRHGHLETVKALHARGASLTRTDDRGWTPLHVASYHGYNSVVVWLLAQTQVDVDATNQQNQTALYEASIYGYAVVVETLLAHGADASIHDNDGNDAISVACRKANKPNKQRIQDLLRNALRGIRPSAKTQQQPPQGGTVENDKDTLCMTKDLTPLPEVAAKTPPIGPLLQESTNGRVFISHTGQDETARNFAANLKDRLEDKGIPYFYDLDSLNPGVHWKDCIHDNVETCAVFLAILSPSYFFRYWCMKELHLALSCHRQIIPIYYGIHGPRDLPREKEAFCLSFSDEQRVEDDDVEQWWGGIHRLPDFQHLQRCTFTSKDGDVQLQKLVLKSINRLLPAQHKSATGGSIAKGRSVHGGDHRNDTLQPKATLSQRIERLEQQLGMNPQKQGGLLERVSSLELNVLGETKAESLSDRLTNIESLVGIGV